MEKGTSGIVNSDHGRHTLLESNRVGIGQFNIQRLALSLDIGHCARLMKPTGRKAAPELQRRGKLDTAI